jgi:hypothetical protein
MQGALHSVSGLKPKPASPGWCTIASVRLLALLLTACSRAALPLAIDAAPPPVSSSAPVSSLSSPAASSSSAPSPPTEWAEGVTPYPGAKELCVEHHELKATSEEGFHLNLPRRVIDTSSYAVAASARSVVLFYKKNLPDVHTSVEGAETRFSLSSGARLSVFSLPAAKTFPSCRDEPGPLDRALIVIHRQTVR